MTKILVMGLPGSGKTTLSRQMAEILKCEVFNADEVRSKYNDWDFSHEGRIRQSVRMRDLCDQSLSQNNKYVIADFVCPTSETRDIFNPDITVWMDTIDKSRYQDTNSVFEPPSSYHFRVNAQSAEYFAKKIASSILEKKQRPVFDDNKPTAQLLGRYQPWHDGHRKLFEEALNRVGQVCIMVRSTSGTDNKNPFSQEDVVNFIKKDLDFDYQGSYKIVIVPNITNVIYGREVGYSIEKITLDEEIENISATKIRKNLGI